MKKQKGLWIVFLIVILTLVGCIPKTAEPAIEPSSTVVVATPAQGTDSVELLVLYTSDEHGWMEGEEPGTGAANLMGIWRDKYGYGENDNIIVLSGGDNWTGPAISTWFEGKSMVEVMNAMGYQASVIGNHEFDFGLDAMEERIKEANFPYLSANMRYKKDRSVPEDMGIFPYRIIDVNGIKVGVIGLTTQSTPTTTNPVNVADFDFIDYEEALREFVPKMRAEGAQLILMPSHVCSQELVPLATRVKDLNIPFMGAGHCHNATAMKMGSSVVLAPGAFYRDFAFEKIKFNPNTQDVLDKKYGVVANEGGEADPQVAAIVDRWKEEADVELNKTIGYLDRTIPKRSQAMQDLITETWLIGYPSADVAITNLGGMRDDLPAGDVTLASIISVMPFNNVLIELHLTGEQLLGVLSSHLDYPATGGIHHDGNHWILDKTGEPLDMTAEYSVLVNDFMYAGGDHYDMLALYDPDAYNTSIDWRQPVIDWVLQQKSSPDHPLDEAIAALGD